MEIIKKDGSGCDSCGKDDDLVFMKHYNYGGDSLFLCESCLKKALELINPKQENLENKIKELEKENKVLNDIFINDRATIINKCVKIIELEKQLAEAKQ